MRIGRCLHSVLVCALLLVSCKHVQDPESRVEVPRDNKQLAIRWVNEIWMAEDLLGVDDLLAPSFVFNWAPAGTSPDLDGYKQALAVEFASFSDHRFTIDDMVAEGDKVVVRWTSRVAHTGDYYGFPPTGKEISVTGISILRMRDGKIVEEVTEMDMLGFMTQLESNSN